jgi:hypothetical protein
MTSTSKPTTRKPTAEFNGRTVPAHTLGLHKVIAGHMGAPAVTPNSTTGKQQGAAWPRSAKADLTAAQTVPGKCSIEGVRKTQQALREQLADQVQAFLAAGGSIEEVPCGLGHNTDLALFNKSLRDGSNLTPKRRPAATPTATPAKQQSQCEAQREAP